MSTLSVAPPRRSRPTLVLSGPSSVNQRLAPAATGCRLIKQFACDAVPELRESGTISATVRPLRALWEEEA